jgi:hypothetical protein
MEVNWKALDDLEATYKEAGWEGVRTKMDAVNLSFVWLNFPGGHGHGGGRVGGSAAAVQAARRLRILEMYFRELARARAERRRRQDEGEPIELTPLEVRQQILKQAEERIARDDSDDLALLMAL